MVFMCLMAWQFSSAQRGYYSISGTPGLMYYIGDMSGDFPDTKTTHFCFGLDFGYTRGGIFKYTLGYQYGKISGADSLIGNSDFRNLHFFSTVHDIRLLAYIDLRKIWMKIKPRKTVGRADWEPGFTGPNLILGLGFFNFNPQGELDGEKFDLQKLGTEGQHISGGDYPTPYSLWAFNLKYGAGIGYNVSRQVNLELQLLYYKTFTDYLDDVSTEYPNYNELIKSDNGDITSYFTYGGKDGSKVQEGKPRGNSAKNDGIVTLGLKVTYTFGRSEFTRIMNL